MSRRLTRISTSEMSIAAILCGMDDPVICHRPAKTRARHQEGHQEKQDQAGTWGLMWAPAWGSYVTLPEVKS
jgi:hypothetical protein